jgi:ech hydrogenase subunit C
MKALSKSPWIIHYDGSSCNGCDIEVLAALTPRYDVERFGIINTGNPKHADILLLTGSINEQNKEVVQNIYSQMPDPKVVVAVGICATSGGIFRECYNVLGGVDKVLPVDLYIPGCPVRPEALIDGVVQGLAVLEKKREQMRQGSDLLEKLLIAPTLPEDAEEILNLQKLAYQSEAEFYGDYGLTPLSQTLDELTHDMQRQHVLKAVFNQVIIGSVRGEMLGNTCRITRLIVHPNYRNFGIGRKLLSAMEGYYTQAKHFEVFTGHKSVWNILFFQKLGYHPTTTQPVTEKRSRIFLQKVNGEA